MSATTVVTLQERARLLGQLAAAHPRPAHRSCPHGDPRPHRCALCRVEARPAVTPVYDRQRAAAGEREDL